MVCDIFTYKTNYSQTPFYRQYYFLGPFRSLIYFLLSQLPNTDTCYRIPVRQVRTCIVDVYAVWSVFVTNPLWYTHYFVCLFVVLFFSVSFMKTRLDADSIGIILLQNFLDEFFPGQVYFIILSIEIEATLWHLFNVDHLYIFFMHSICDSGFCWIWSVGIIRIWRHQALYSLSLQWPWNTDRRWL